MYLIYYKFIKRDEIKRDMKYSEMSQAEANRICNHLNSVYNTIIWSYRKEM
jgi:hypothetical protein